MHLVPLRRGTKVGRERPYAYAHGRKALCLPIVPLRGRAKVRPGCPYAEAHRREALSVLFLSLCVRDQNALRTHTGEKSFACALCSFTCAQRSNLVQHVRRRHAGEKPFVCSLCPYAGAAKTQLVVHMRTHTGVKPFACCLCPQCVNNQAAIDIPCTKEACGKRVIVSPLPEKSFVFF